MILGNRLSRVQDIGCRLGAIAWIMRNKQWGIYICPEKSVFRLLYLRCRRTELQIKGGIDLYIFMYNVFSPGTDTINMICVRCRQNPPVGYVIISECSFKEEFKKYWRPECCVSISGYLGKATIFKQSSDWCYVAPPYRSKSTNKITRWRFYDLNSEE